MILQSDVSDLYFTLRFTSTLNCPRHVTTLDSSFLFAGYGRREAVEILLNAGATVHARDDGGLIPLHNAASYGHVDIAALLIKFNTCVNATDRYRRRGWSLMGQL